MNWSVVRMWLVDIFFSPLNWIGSINQLHDIHSWLVCIKHCSVHLVSTTSPVVMSIGLETRAIALRWSQFFLTKGKWNHATGTFYIRKLFFFSVRSLSNYSSKKQDIIHVDWIKKRDNFDEEGRDRADETDPITVPCGSVLSPRDTNTVKTYVGQQISRHQWIFWRMRYEEGLQANEKWEKRGRI